VELTGDRAGAILEPNLHDVRLYGARGGESCNEELLVISWQVYGLDPFDAVESH
jgi:hypothetical protein